MEGLTWEYICDDTYRLKVPGGFIVRYSTYSSNTGDQEPTSVSVSVAMVFVPFDNK
jgi:hypothetical protein